MLLVPSLVSLIWFTIFGGAGIDALQEGTFTLVNGAVNSNHALYELLESYPWASVTSVLIMILVGIFFVSGADAASLVMGTLSEHGTTEPSRATVIFWGALTGTVAAIMLAIGDPANPGEALTGLQNLTIVVALPFVIVMVLLCLALYRDLRRDPMMLRHLRGNELIEKPYCMARSSMARSSTSSSGKEIRCQTHPRRGTGHRDLRPPSAVRVGAIALLHRAACFAAVRRRERAMENGTGWPSVGFPDRTQKRPGPLLLRMLVQLGGRALFVDLPLVEEAHPIRELTGKAHLVGDHEHGQVVLAAEPADDIEHFTAQLGSKAEVTSSNSITLGRMAKAGRWPPAVAGHLKAAKGNGRTCCPARPFPAVQRRALGLRRA